MSASEELLAAHQAQLKEVVASQVRLAEQFAKLLDQVHELGLHLMSGRKAMDTLAGRVDRIEGERWRR